MSSNPEQGATGSEALRCDICARQDRGVVKPEHCERLCEQHLELASELREWCGEEPNIASLFGCIELYGRPAPSEERVLATRAFQAGEKIGDVLLIRLGGKGGTRRVWEAEKSSQALRQVGLKHPTDAQWEGVARAGSDSPVAGGVNVSLSARSAHLADDWPRLHNAGFANDASWSDGYTAHAPVASLAANAYSSHDMLGNAWELCSDASGNCPTEMQLDPELPGNSNSLRLLCGDGFLDLVQHARVSVCENRTPDICGASTGVRPARGVFP
jgi:hypothetical protein